MEEMPVWWLLGGSLIAHRAPLRRQWTSPPPWPASADVLVGQRYGGDDNLSSSQHEWAVSVAAKDIRVRGANEA